MSEQTIPPYSNWAPSTLEEVQQELGDIDWILAGGIALEQFVGRSYREHGDIDVLIKREDQHKIYGQIEAERIFIATRKGKLSPAEPNQYYDKPIQDIWILDPTQTHWSLQIMLFDLLGERWVYKRNEQINLLLNDIYFEKDGVKILKPEIQLLYKSKNIREKDQQDYEKIAPLLADNAMAWLKNSLTTCYGHHTWLK